MTLTEFEKTILLSLFVLAKGSTHKYIPQELLLSKFPTRQRKAVKIYLEKLTKQDFLIRDKTKENYRVEKKALKDISTFLIKGPKVRL